MAKEYRRLAKLIAEFHFKEDMDKADMHNSILLWKSHKDNPMELAFKDNHEFYGRSLAGYFRRRRRNAPEIPFNKLRPLVQMYLGWSPKDVEKRNDIVLGRVDSDIVYYVVFEQGKNWDNDRFFMDYSLALSYYYHLISDGVRLAAYLNNRDKEWRSVEELRFAVQGRVDS
jgi:hypothetical protein